MFLRAFVALIAGVAFVWRTCGEIIEPGDLVNASLIGKLDTVVDQQLDAMALIDRSQFLQIDFAPVFPVSENGKFVRCGDLIQKNVKHSKAFRSVGDIPG